MGSITFYFLHRKVEESFNGSKHKPAHSSKGVGNALAYR